MTPERHHAVPFASEPCPGSRGVLVLGMHRSGTSVATEIVCRLGLTAGAAAGLIGASPFNPRGHFELRSGVEFDNDVLQRAGGTWDGPPPPESIENLAAAVRPSIDAWFGRDEAWTFKDPRLCLTLPIWLRALAGYDVRIVHMMRDPHAVARSLMKRNQVQDVPASRFERGQMRASDALALWSEYNRRAVLYEERYALPRLVVWYDQLVGAPAREVPRLAAFIGCELTDAEAVIGCIRPELQRA